jgi:hypothetical protein
MKIKVFWDLTPSRLVVTADAGRVCSFHLSILRSLQIFTNLRSIISQHTWTAISTTLHYKYGVINPKGVITLYAICIFKRLGNNKGTLLGPLSFLLQCENHRAPYSFATVPCINRSFLYQLILSEWVHPLCENWMKFPGTYWEFTCLTMDSCPITTSCWEVGSYLRGVNEMWQQHHAVLVNSSICIGQNVWFLLLRVSFSSGLLKGSLLSLTHRPELSSVFSYTGHRGVMNEWLGVIVIFYLFIFCLNFCKKLYTIFPWRDHRKWLASQHFWIASVSCDAMSLCMIFPAYGEFVIRFLMMKMRRLRVESLWWILTLRCYTKGIFGFQLLTG